MLSLGVSRRVVPLRSGLQGLGQLPHVVARGWANDADLRAGGPVVQRGIWLPSKLDLGLLAEGRLLEMPGDVLHAVVPGIGAAELHVAARCGTLQKSGQLAAVA